MKTFLYTFFLVCTCMARNADAQGWKAIVALEFRDGYHPVNTLPSVRVYYSGVTVYGWSPSSAITLEITGEGVPGGYVEIYALASTTYEQVSISVRSTENIQGNCYPVTLYDYSQYPRVVGTIVVYPRLTIDHATQACDAVTMRTDVCTSAFYTWEVSESNSGPYKKLPNNSNPIVRVTTDDLVGLGFSGYGRKFFRVTGISGTTSPIKIVDMYYPPPTASFSFTSPQCHDGSDGVIEIHIESYDPARINDFIISVFKLGSNELPLQYPLDNSLSMTVGGLKAGSYNIQIQNNSDIKIYGSCFADFEVGPLVNPPEVLLSSAQVSDYNGYQVSCKDGNNGVLAVQPSGGTGTYSAYDWTPLVSTTSTAVNLLEGTYKVRVKDSNNCWSNEFSRTLIAPEKLSATLQSTGGKGGFDVSCADLTDGAIASTISGGLAPYGYAWSSGSTTPGLTGVGAGIYQVTVNDHNGCTAEASLTLLAPEPIDFSIGEVSGIHCAGDHSGVLEVQSVTNTIGSTFYLWSSGESGIEIYDKPAGNYSVTVSDEQGCEQTRPAILEEPPAYSVQLIPRSDFNGIPIRCNGEASGSLEAIVRDDLQNIVPAEYYSWYRNDNELIGGGATRSILEQVAAGTYKVKIAYRGVCETESTFTLTEPDPVLPVIFTMTNYNGQAITCHGASDAGVKAVASGGTGNQYVYQWNTGEITAALNGIAAGSYTVTATDINGCSGTAGKTISDPAPVEASIAVLSNFNGQAISCNSASDARIRGEAKGGTPSFTYSWNTGEVAQYLIDIPAGNYIFTAKDANGCTSVAETIITNPLRVEADIVDISDYNGFGVSCNGAHDGFLLSHPTGGTGNYTFNWNGGEHWGNLYSNLGAGDYTLIATDDNGCADTNTVRVIEPPPLILNVAGIENITCNEGQDGAIHLEAAGGAGAYAYATVPLPWQSEPTLAGLKAEVYAVSVRDANGCTKTIDQTLTEPPALSIHFENIQPALCGEPRGNVTSRVSGGTGTYQYLWINSDSGLVSDEPAASALFAGVYTVKVADEHGCLATESVGISSTDGPHIQINNVVPATCSYSTDGSAEVKIAEGDGPFTFLWQNGQRSAQASNLATGNHFVEVKDANGCAAVAAVTITAPEPLEIDLVQKSEPTCHGSCDGKLSVVAQGGNGSYSYEWGDRPGTGAGSLCAGQYTVNVTDIAGCRVGQTFSLHDPEPLSLKLVSTRPPVCAGGCDGSLSISASGGTGEIRYNWSTGAEISELTNLCAGSYTATIRDENQCTANQTFTIENPPADQVDLGGAVTLCEGQTHILDPGAHWQDFDWTSSTGFKSDAQRVTISQGGTYWLKVISNKGCTALDTFYLQTSRELLKANFLLTSEAAVNDTIVLIDISWPLPERSRWLLPETMNNLADYGDVVYGKFGQTGRYDISLETMLGSCRDQLTKTITIYDQEESVNDAGRLGGYEAFVREFTLYPNPNEGMFDVEIGVLEETPIVLSVWNMMTAREVSHVVYSGKLNYTTHFDLRPLSAGTYSLRLDYGKGTKYLRFIVR